MYAASAYVHVLPARLKKVPVAVVRAQMASEKSRVGSEVKARMARVMHDTCAGSAVREVLMPEKEVIERARQDAREGKSPSTQAGEFVHEEIEHVREGKHGATSTKQAIAIGLSKARRAGVKLPPPGAGISKRARRKAARDLAIGQGHPRGRKSRKRARATTRVLKRQGRSAASRKSLSKQASAAARKRGRAARSAAARKAMRTKGPRGRSAAAKKAARTRARAT